ncbi:MAG: GtrA family protein [Microscillaceae bacterium]|nr:GtrA family protein [Microscillaceae bacterium]
MEKILKLGTELYQKFTTGVYRQFFKFAMAGAICAVLEMSILVTLSNIYGKDNLLYFNALAYIVAVVLNYLISRAWVFERGKYNTKVEFLAFCAVATVGLGLNQLIFYWGLQVLTNDFYLLAKIIAIGTVVIWNFFAKKYLVFKG